MRYLSSNAKLELAPIGRSFTTAGLAFAPNRQSGHNVCPQATDGCTLACTLWFSGRTVQAAVRQAAIRRTRAFFADRAAFIEALALDVEHFGRRARAKGMRPLVRLNVASDLDWRRLAPAVFEAAARARVTLYDYTKDHARALRELAQAATVDAPWHLTYSVSEKTTYSQAMSVLQAGGSLTVPFLTRYHASSATPTFGALPARVAIHKIGTDESCTVDAVDGDRHDARLPAVDGRGVVVALRAKGTRASIRDGAARGFLRPLPEAYARVHYPRKVRKGEAPLYLP